MQYILLYISHFICYLVGEGEELRGTVGKAFARFRQTENTVPAVYKAHTELGFKRGHGTAHRRVADEHTTPGCGEAFCAGDLKKGP